MKTMSKTDKVLEAFKNGERLTAKQIKSWFRVGNPHEVVRQIRLRGYPIYNDPHTNKSGKTRNFYKLGTPSRRVVAAGYRALQGQL